MVTNPTNLAVRTRSSLNALDARKRVLHLYRNWQRAAPQVTSLYVLELPASAVRAKIRQEFEKHRFVKDLPAIDMLVFKGTAEFQETLNYWKQEGHIMQYFKTEEEPLMKRPQSFLGKFLEGEPL